VQFKNATVHCKYDFIVYHKSESVDSYFIRAYMTSCIALWATNRNVGYVLSMLEHDRNS